MRSVERICIMLAFHEADSNTDILADILARIVARMSACRSACHRNEFNCAYRTCRRGSLRGSRCRCRRRGMRALPCQISSKSVSQLWRYCNFSFLQDGGSARWRQSAILDLFTVFWTTDEEYFVMSIIVQNLVAIDESFESVNIYIVCLKRAYSRTL